MRVVQCTYGRHAEAILDIFNDTIVHTTALYDYQPRPPESMVAWFADKQVANYPVIGAETQAGELMGFASYGRFRPHAAYKYTVEHSVYVRRDYRRTGVALTLMHELIAVARAQGYHVLVGGIDAQNHGSRALHEKLGFTHAGTVREAGFKFNRWLDLALYQLVLNTPAMPVEG